MRYRKHRVYAPIFCYCEPICQLNEALNNPERSYDWNYFSPNRAVESILYTLRSRREAHSTTIIDSGRCSVLFESLEFICLNGRSIERTVCGRLSQVRALHEGEYICNLVRGFPARTRQKVFQSLAGFSVGHQVVSVAIAKRNAIQTV